MEAPAPPPRRRRVYARIARPAKEEKNEELKLELPTAPFTELPDEATNYIINGKTYDTMFNSPESIKIAYAAEKKTLPKWVYIGRKDTTSVNPELIAIDLKEIVSGIFMPEADHKMKEVYDKIILPFFPEMKTDFPLFYISFITPVVDSSIRENALLIQTSLEGILKTFGLNPVQTANLIDQRKGYIDAKNRFIKSFLDDHEKGTEAIRKLRKLEAVEHASNTKLMAINISYQFNLEADIYNLFNSLVPTQNIPLIRLNNFFKIARNFIPPESINYYSNPEEEDMIHLFYNASKNPAKFIKADITIEETTTNEFKILVEVFTGTEIDTILRDFSTVCEEKIEFKNKKETGVRIEFAVPNIDYNKTVFRDILLNNQLISEIFFVNESVQIGRKRESISFYTADGGLCTISAFQADATSARKYNEYFISTQPYIHVGIRNIQTKRNAEQIKDLLLRTLSIFNKEKDEILDFYQKYLPKENLGTKKIGEKKKVRTKKYFGDEDEALFTKFTLENGKTVYFSHECASERKFDFMDRYDEDEKEAIREAIEEKSSYTIKYPMKLLPPFEKQYELFCPACDPEREDEKNEGYYFPGVKSHPDYPYPWEFIPCCFKTSQLETPKYQAYLEGKKYEKKKKTSEYRYTSNKPLPIGRVGDVPSGVTDLLMIGSEPDTVYSRYAVELGPNSFIEAVLYLVKPKFRRQPESKKKEIISAVRESFMNQTYYDYISQEAYSKNRNELGTILADQEAYIDPKLWMLIFEEKYQVNIFLFEASPQNKDGLLVAPYFIQEYLKNFDTEYNSIFILENKHGVQPHYEPIASTTTSVFDYDSPVTEYVKKAFKSLYQFYRIEMSRPFPKFKHEITGKGSDFFGKMRFLWFGEDLCMEIPPFYQLRDIPEKTASLQPVNAEIAKQFILDEGDTFENYVFHDEKAVAIIGTKTMRDSVFQYTIPIISVDSKDLIDMRKDHPFPELEIDSELHKLRHLQKLQQYLLEYTKWLYSRFLKKGGKSFSDFQKECFEVVPDFKYDEVLSNRFVDDFLHDGKLIVPNEEIRTRLIYGLEIACKHDPHEIDEYGEKKFMKNYFKTKFDFQPNKAFILLDGDEAVDSYIRSKVAEDFIISTSVQPGKEGYLLELAEPAELKGEYLVSEGYNFQNALWILSQWKEKKVNERDEPYKWLLPEEETFSVIIYNGIDRIKIRHYQKGEKIANLPENSLGIILMYQYKDVLHYLALLHLD